MPGDPPETPPQTPNPGDGKGPGPANVKGNLDFTNAEISRSIVTGHVHGYEVIIATVNVAVDSATNLDRKIQDFIARVDLQLTSVSDKVGATRSTLDSITGLVVRQAKKEGLEVDKDVKQPKEYQRTKDGTGGGEEEAKYRQGVEEVLTLTCFKNLMEASRGVEELFKSITEKIQDAKTTIDYLHKVQVPQGNSHQVNTRGADTQTQNPHGPYNPQRPCSQKMRKVSLSDEEKRQVLLTDEAIDLMGKNVDIHKYELFQRFLVFELELFDKRQGRGEDELKSVSLTVQQTYIVMKQLARFLTNGGRNPLEVENPHHGPHPLLPNAQTQHGRDTLPHPARLVSSYMGWVFRKAPPPPPPYNHPEASQRPSWKWAIAVRVPFSTEELFLKVLAQVAHRAKFDRTLHDECLRVLKKPSQKMLVDGLLASQNSHLQKGYPQLEWTIAGLEPVIGPWDVTPSSINGQGVTAFKASKKKSIITGIEVILKTQWRLTPRPGSLPRAPLEMGAPVPIGPRPLGPGSNPTSLPANGGAAPQNSPNVPRGSAGPAGGGSAPLATGRGRDTVPIIIDAGVGTDTRANNYTTSQASRHHLAQQARFARHRAIMVVREPKFVLVKEGAKKRKKHGEEERKSAHKYDKSNRHEKGKGRVYIELREPGTYYERTRTSSGPSGGHRQYPSHPNPNGPVRPASAPNLHPLPRAYQPTGFIPEETIHISSSPPQVPPPPPQPQAPHIHLSSPQLTREQEEEDEKEAEEATEQLFEEFSELTDKKGKTKSKTRWRPESAPLNQDIGHHDHADRVRIEEERRRMEADRTEASSEVGLVRSLMRRVERESCRRMSEEEKQMHITKAKLEKMKRQQNAPSPPRPHRHEPELRPRKAEEYNMHIQVEERRPPPPAAGPSRRRTQENDYHDHVRQAYQEEEADERIRLVDRYNEPHQRRNREGQGRR